MDWPDKRRQVLLKKLTPQQCNESFEFLYKIILSNKQYIAKYVYIMSNRYSTHTSLKKINVLLI